MGLIADQWAKFEQEIYSGAPDDMLRHIRQAFYAGASATFLAITDDPRRLEAIKAELLDAALKFGGEV